MFNIIKNSYELQLRKAYYHCIVAFAALGRHGWWHRVRVFHIIMRKIKRSHPSDAMLVVVPTT